MSRVRQRVERLARAFGRSRRARGWAWSVCVRGLVLSMLVFAVPASHAVARDLVAWVSSSCADGCAEHADDEGVCLDGCGHCACCQPRATPALPAVLVPELMSHAELALVVSPDAHPSAYPQPPFRPPTR